jgi:hypothetical protein
VSKAVPYPTCASCKIPGVGGGGGRRLFCNNGHTSVANIARMSSRVINTIIRLGL